MMYSKLVPNKISNVLFSILIMYMLNKHTNGYKSPVLISFLGISSALTAFDYQCASAAGLMIIWKLILYQSAES